MKLVHEAQRKVESEAFRAAELAEIDALAAIVEHRKCVIVVVDHI